MKPGAWVCRVALLVVFLIAGPYPLARGESDVLRNLIDKGDFRAALALVDAALDNRPEDRSMLLHRGFLLVSLGRLAEAEEHYREMQTALPDMPEPGNNLAIVYRNQGRMQEALLVLAEVIEAFPLFEQAHDNLRDICDGSASDALDDKPDARQLCDAFDHDAATRAREAAREALPLVVEKNSVVEVIALRPVEFSSAPLDENDGEGESTVGPRSDDDSLRRELDDLAREFESFRGRMVAELDAANTAKAAAESESAVIREANADLAGLVATAEKKLAALEADLAESEKQREEAARAAGQTDPALKQLEAAVRQAETARAAAEKSLADRDAELASSRAEIERVEAIRAGLQAEMSAAVDAQATLKQQLQSERQAREQAERRIAELQQQLASLQKPEDEPAPVPDAAPPAPDSGNSEVKVATDKLDDEAAPAGLTSDDSTEVAGAAEAVVGDGGGIPDDAVEREDEVARWQRWLDENRFDQEYLRPPDHIRWQVEHVVTRWFDTYHAGDVDAHVALYSPAFSGFRGSRQAAWMDNRFAEETDGGAAGFDASLMRMRQTTADSAEIFLPPFNTLPAAAGGQVLSLLLQYRHGRWQIRSESVHGRPTD